MTTIPYDLHVFANRQQGALEDVRARAVFLDHPIDQFCNAVSGRDIRFLYLHAEPDAGALAILTARLRHPNSAVWRPELASDPLTQEKVAS